MPNTHNLPTLDDVAREAGVSTATVSRCLNGSGKVSERARDKVMQAVDQLGYTPNFAARVMAAKRSMTIGAIIPTMENAIFARGLQAFQETLNDRGFTLLVSSTGYNPEREAEQIRTLIARGADGLLLIGYERDQAIYEYLSARKVPYLLSWAYRLEETHPAIGFDNFRSMRDLARTVTKQGHQRVAVICGIRDGNDRAQDRLRGIRAGMAEAGIAPEEIPVIETPYSVENGAEAFQALMKASETPTVVMCVNDVLAVGAMQRARDMNIDVPGQISITGFDDIEIASLTTPKLTTVHVPHGHMGSLAAQELINLIEQKDATRSYCLQSSIRMRESLDSPAT